MAAEPAVQRGRPGYDRIFTPWIYVRDLDKAAAWYSRVLGLEQEFRLPGNGWCELGTGIDRVAIGLHQAGHAVQGSGATLTFGVLDLDAERRRLEELAVRLDGPTTGIPGVIKMATFRDPDANPLMFCQVLGRPRHDTGPR
jgi:catechol 2,3-dioxygenase-like lactoylglutathione lyase family enzyme